MLFHSEVSKRIISTYISRRHFEFTFNEPTDIPQELVNANVILTLKRMGVVQYKGQKNLKKVEKVETVAEETVTVPPPSIMETAQTGRVAVEPKIKGSTKGRKKSAVQKKP